MLAQQELGTDSSDTPPLIHPTAPPSPHPLSATENTRNDSPLTHHAPQPTTESPPQEHPYNLSNVIPETTQDPTPSNDHPGEKALDDIATHTQTLAGKNPVDSTTKETKVRQAELALDTTLSSTTLRKFVQRAGVEDMITRFLKRDERELAVVAVVGGLAVLRVCLPHLNWSTIVVGILGVGLGGFVAAFYLLSVPEATRIKRASTMAKFGKLHDHNLVIVDGVPVWSDQGQDAKDVKEKEPETTSLGIHLKESKDEDYTHVKISPEIDPLFEDMISYTLRDFVNVPVGLVSQGQHNIPLRASLVAMVMNLSKRLSNIRMPETALLAVFGLQNSFIVHLRAYRELRASRLPIADYVTQQANPDSVIGRCYDKDERLKQFRSTARAMCQSLMSKNDQQSVSLFAVMQEIMATHVLESTLETMCDPDYINLSIIDYFNTSTAEAVKTGQDGTNGSSTIASSSVSNGAQTQTSLADSILMNAAHLMDMSAIDKQGAAISEGFPATVNSPVPQRPAPLRSNSAFKESNEPDRIASTTPKQPSTLTLKQVLTHKNEHNLLFQDFMDYLQVWDAMDLAQFWLMIDIFHRQIEQGMLSEMEDLRREAGNIFEQYCGSDPDRNVTGIREAKGGAVLKNLKKAIVRDPATCFREPQDWALSVLESQHWVPFELQMASKKSLARKASVSSVHSPSSDKIDAPSRTDSPSSRMQSPLERRPSPSQDTTAFVGDHLPVPTPAPAPMISHPVVESIHVSDMVNRRPKTLMSNAELSYMIEVQTEGGQGWMVTRTFQQIEQFQVGLVQQFPIVQRTVFPRWRLQPSDKVCHGLQNFLRAMLTIPEVSESARLAWFLSKAYDEGSDGVFHDPNAPIAQVDQNKALGLATQGAKTALRQASEASMSAGRFFKSLGTTAAGAVNIGQGKEEGRNVRGSFESGRSSIAEGGASSSSLLETPLDPHSRMSSSSERLMRTGSTQSLRGPSIEQVLSSPPPPPVKAQQSVLGSPLTIAHSVADTLVESVQGKLPIGVAGDHAPSAARSSVGSLEQTEKRSATPAPDMSSQGTNITSTPTPAPTSTPVPDSTAPSVTPAAAAAAPKKNTAKLLTNDELDLLIETSFTVLEDMMDFAKGQSIRRMTFGMLRELVRKSYRVAINQSFSEWAESNSNRDKALELAKWMKDDLFWPNGVWPMPPPPRLTDANGNPLALEAGDETVYGPPLRTLQEKEATREKARELMKVMLPGSLVTVLGKEAALRGLMDVFEMFQIKELNLGLALSALEMAVRLVFTR